MEWYVFAIFAAILAAFQVILEKKSLYKIHSLNLSALLSIFNFLVMLVFIGNINLILSTNVLSTIYLSSLVATFAFWFAAKSIHHLEVSVSTPLLTLVPAVTAILAYAILGESINAVHIFGLSLLVIGSYVLELGQNIGDFLLPFKRIFKMKYIAYVFLALLFYGVSSIYDRFILNPVNNLNVTPLTYIFYLQFFIMINFAILTMLFYDGFNGIKTTLSHVGLPLIIALAVLITLSRIFYAQAASLTSIALVYAVFKSSSFFVTLSSGYLFKEKDVLKKSIASLIIIIGAYLIIS